MSTTSLLHLQTDVLGILSAMSLNRIVVWRLIVLELKNYLQMRFFLEKLKWFKIKIILR